MHPCVTDTLMVTGQMSSDRSCRCVRIYDYIISHCIISCVSDTEADTKQQIRGG